MMRLDIQLTETLERIDSVYDKVINRYEWCSIFLDQVRSNFACIGFAPTWLIKSRGSNSNEGKMYHTWSIIASVPVGYHCSIFSQQVNHKAAYASCVNNAAIQFHHVYVVGLWQSREASLVVTGNSPGLTSLILATKSRECCIFLQPISHCLLHYLFQGQREETCISFEYEGGSISTTSGADRKTQLKSKNHWQLQ